ncbi:hypothetical protein GUJ93_ZPchr0006g44892 [Zizania palustris]|uniref:PGG domain-containing protein n=1 Tax=Zizania palustris TaxID=103762 RepID=A0A8J5W3I7_ZIZPA|nr:hypothetical protein GUJ93_ZPchr0006g44892 [Zizania palustris]
MHDKFKARYKTFYYFNSTALVTSLVITVLLMSERFYRSEIKGLTLILATVVDLASLVGAYIAGSTRFTSSGVYSSSSPASPRLRHLMGEVLGQICGFFHIKCLACSSGSRCPGGGGQGDPAARYPRRMAQAAAPASNKHDLLLVLRGHADHR